MPVFVDIRAGHAEPRRGAGRGGDHAAHAGDRRRSTTPASACEMDDDHGDRRGGTACWSSRTPRRALMSTYRGRPLGSDRPAGGAQLPRDEEHHLRRGRRADRQRSALRRAGRDHPREGHEPQQVLPRRGRQIHLGRHRLVLSAERDHRRLPAGAVREAATLTEARRVCGTAITTVWRSSSARAFCAGRSCRKAARTTPTCTTAASAIRRRGRP